MEHKKGTTRLGKVFGRTILKVKSLLAVKEEVRIEKFWIDANGQLTILVVAPPSIQTIQINFRSSDENKT